jgi:hypothetical protein
MGKKKSKLRGSSSVVASSSGTPDDVKISEACRQGDITQLRRLARQGIHVLPLVPIGEHLADSIRLGSSLDLLRCLVKELDADVNQATFDGFTPLYLSAEKGDVAEVVCLVEELGADVNRGIKNGSMPLHAATLQSHLDVMRSLVNDLGASVNQGMHDGNTPLHIAAQIGDLATLRCLVDELGADVNRANVGCATPVMIASCHKHAALVKWLVKAGADLKLAMPLGITAADISNFAGASPEQTAYLEAKTHCSNAGCSGTGLMKCTGCKKARYCGEACQLAHWKAHKADCKRWAAELKAGTNEG